MGARNNERKDEWEEEYKRWKAEKELKKAKKLEEYAVDFPEIFKEEKEKKSEEIKAGKGKEWKIVIWLIPVLIIGYLIYANFIATQEFDYTYDIGSGGDNYLTPVDRMGEIGIENGVNYRNITNGLVYFDVPVVSGAESIEVEMRFKPNFPNGTKMTIGAKDQDIWHYTYNTVYNPKLDELVNYKRNGNVYRINQEKRVVGIKELLRMDNIVIATDQQIERKMNKVSDYEKKESVINASLRGGHTFYVYASGGLDLNVKKQDLNWYNGTDNLEVSVFDFNGKLLGNMTIADDGIIDNSKKVNGTQEGELRLSGLQEGVYRIEFKDFDGLIREIRVNSNKIVSEKLFLADSSVYGLQNKDTLIYFESGRAGQLRLLTYHKEGLQDIKYESSNGASVFFFDTEDKPMYMDYQPGSYLLDLPKNDIAISGNYLAFSEENYFEPFRQKVIALEPDFEWLEKNADYVVADYSPIKEEGEWVVATTKLDIEDRNLYIKDNKINFLINVPHLGNEKTKNMTIPVDWIKIKVYKTGVIL